jgi:hypothetical protein
LIMGRLGVGHSPHRPAPQTQTMRWLRLKALPFMIGAPATSGQRKGVSLVAGLGTKDKWAMRLGLGSLVLWVLTWGLIWQGRVNERWGAHIFEPALIAIQLGGVSIAVFLALYMREREDRMRSALAGAVVIPFLLLVVDLLTLPDFRGSLGGGVGGSGASVSVAARLDFVQQLFDTFRWVVTAVVGFYFSAEAAEAITDKVQAGRTNRSRYEAMKAQAEAQAAAGLPVPSEALLHAKSEPSR